MVYGNFANTCSKNDNYKHKHTVLFIEDNITICECLDKDTLRVRLLENTISASLTISTISVILTFDINYIIHTELFL